jgi:hypothetical protein
MDLFLVAFYAVMGAAVVSIAAGAWTILRR